MKQINLYEPKYVVMTTTVLSEIALKDAPFQNIADEHLNFVAAELLVPILFFEPNIMDVYKEIGATPKEIQKLKLVLDHPYRLVVKPDVVLSDGSSADWGIALFDVLENNYLEMGVNLTTRELTVLDSYYRHNDLMAKDVQQMHEQNLVKLATRLALAVAHYTTEDASVMETQRVKWLKSPFATARERQMKHIYRSRYQTIQTWLTVDLVKKSLQSEVASESQWAKVVSGQITFRETSETTPSETVESVVEEPVTSTVIEVEELKAEPTTPTIEVEVGASAKKITTKKPRQAKEKKEEIVLEVLEDGTKIVQYERAGYWRTQRNKTTGEEKKIWIEPKLMTRRVVAK